MKTRHGVLAAALLALAAALPKAPALAASDQACYGYAKSAVADFALGSKYCRIRADARWQADFQNHYKWCRTVPDAAWQAERDARNAKLLACGARHKID